LRQSQVVEVASKVIVYYIYIYIYIYMCVCVCVCVLWTMTLHTYICMYSVCLLLIVSFHLLCFESRASEVAPVDSVSSWYIDLCAGLPYYLGCFYHLPPAPSGSSSFTLSLVGFQLKAVLTAFQNCGYYYMY
jgi:hypothetical protein